MGVVMAVTLIAVVSTVAGQQSGQGQQTPNPAQKKYPYPVVRDLAATVPRGPRLMPSPPLGAGPWTYETTEAKKIRVSVVTRGFSHPYGFAFLPDGVILITERAGALRVVRNGVMDPNPVAGVPKVIYRGTEAGLMDVVLHPAFEKNHWVYFTYHKPIGDNLASNAVGRGTWDGKALTDVKEIFLSDDVDTEVSRITFGRDGMLYMTIGGPGTGPAPSLNRPQHGNDYAGKLLRMRDDGSLPPDNPFVGKKDYKPYIYAMGFRNQLGLTMNPFNGEIWAAEQGPNGGDEVNVIRAGKNYGWPFASYGRDYFGPRFNSAHAAQGFEEPTRVLGTVDCRVRHDVLQRRSLPRLAAQSVRRRYARRRDVTHRQARSHRVQRRLAGDASRIAAARSASANPRRETRTRRVALRRHGRRRRGAVAH